MNEGRWERFCVVGVGGHARNRLIPAIAANGQELAGIVSSKPAAELPTAPAFRTIDEAVAALPADTAFVIASPPSAHAAQAALILAAGRDVIVEKPAFVTTAEALAAAAAATDCAILVEAFMNRHTATHRRFLAKCARDTPIAIECTFTIPEAPAGTFRSDPAIGASNLYDIAAYFLAALADAGLPLDRIELDGVDRAGQPDRERLHLTGHAGEVQISAVTGIDDAYANRLGVSHADGSTVAYNPFFYGRAAVRTIATTRDRVTTEETIDDGNAFEAMLAMPRRDWLADQDARLQKMVAITAALERLGGDLARFRAAA